MSASASRCLTSSDRRDTRSLSLKDLLNPVDDTVSHTETGQQSERTSRGATTPTDVRTYPRPEDCIAKSVSLPSGIDSQQSPFVDNAPDTFNLPKMTTGRPFSSRFYGLTTPAVRMSSGCQMGHESQAQNCNRPGDFNLTPSQPILRDHYGTPVHAEATASNFTYQRHSHFGNMLPSSDPSSTVPQIGVETTKAQYSMMTREMEQGIQIPVDTQAGSNVAGEKRKRAAEASTRARKRRKDKGQDSAATIAALEKVAEETLYYRKERDHFRNVVFTLYGSIEPRPPSPNPRRHVTLIEASPAHY